MREKAQAKYDKILEKYGDPDKAEAKSAKYFEKADKYQEKADQYKCNEPPEFINPPSDPVTNQGTFVLTEDANQESVPFLTVVATDPDADILVYGDLAGEDVDTFDFNTTTGELSIKPGFGPISPGGDFDGDGNYELEFTVTDPGGLTDTLLLEIIISSGG